MDTLSSWKALADDLGFVFKEGLSAFMESPSLIRFAGSALKTEDFEKAKAMLDNPLVRAMAASLLPGCVTGFYRNFEFTLFESSTSSSSDSGTSHHIHIAMLFSAPLNAKLQITPAGFWTRVGKRLFSNRYLFIEGNSALDRNLAVRTNNKARVSLLLGDRKIHDALEKLVSLSNDFTVSDYGIRHKRPGRTLGRDEALPIMDAMADAGPLFG